MRRPRAAPPQPTHTVIVTAELRTLILRALAEYGLIVPGHAELCREAAERFPAGLAVYEGFRRGSEEPRASLRRLIDVARPLADGDVDLLIQCAQRLTPRRS